jgi:NAD(P)-dependent dehydrogenase (short-subunit alcohol dehydrogenase family)
MILEDKVVIVSGIGPGLGQELAIGAGREGAKVVLAARTESFLQEVETVVRKSGAETLVVPTDITDEEQCRRLVDATIERFGRVDALINSAFTEGALTLFEESNLADWRRVMEVNLFGALTLSQLVVPHMKEQGGGAIVNINTMVQRKPMPMQSSYGTSKGALTAATRMLAKELGAHRIRVNAVSMGWMWGPPVEGYIKGVAKQMGVPMEEVLSGVTQEIPLGEIPDDADCANAALFLASDLARVITGANLDCNGGELMT